jgi:hypothetical protein
MRQYIACAVMGGSGENGSPEPIEIGLVDERGVVRHHAHRRSESGSLRSGSGMVRQVMDTLSEPVVYAFDGSDTRNQLTRLAETETDDGIGRRPRGGGAAADVEDLEWRSLRPAVAWSDAIPGASESLESACRAAGIAVGPKRVRQAVHRALLTRLLHRHLLSAARKLDGTFQVASTDTGSDETQDESDSPDTDSGRPTAVPDPDVILPGLPTDLHDLQTDSDTSLLPMTALPPVYVATDRPPSANVATGIALLDNEGSPILSEALRPGNRTRRAALLTREDVDEEIRTDLSGAPPYDRLRRMLRRHLLGREVRIWDPDGLKSQIQTLHTGLPGPDLQPLAQTGGTTADGRSGNQQLPHLSASNGSAPRTWAEELTYTGICDRWVGADRLDTQPTDTVFDAARACRKTFSPPEMNGSNGSAALPGADRLPTERSEEAQRSYDGSDPSSEAPRPEDGFSETDGRASPHAQAHSNHETGGADSGPAERALARAKAARQVDRYLRGD